MDLGPSLSSFVLVVCYTENDLTETGINIPLLVARKYHLNLLKSRLY